MGINYIENRLNANAMLGGFIHNNLCGFIWNHEEGSIGMLEVFPKYIGRGIGSALQIAATNEALANKSIPKDKLLKQIKLLLHFQKKLDFKFSNNKTCWLIK
ncbi:hypothetical protein [Clostridium puniceum]|uniref:hypothetical protein n=1 Tax=Clostridium puniceum TaxID=29367 RepID=UPI001FA8B0CB|nr:hypothetical protein [Clostridium puniceum]